jgi:methionyl-tRNA synthetase
MKDTSDEILRQLGLSNDIKWSDLDNYYDIHNAKVIEKGEPIFVRLNVQEEINYIQGLMKK